MSFYKFKTLSLLLLLVFTAQYVKSTDDVKTESKTEAPKEIKKVRVHDTKLCMKCDCYQSSSVLNCSNRKIDNITSYFAADEWNALQYDLDNQFETINFEWNLIKQIPEFPPLENLKILNFHNNQIENITSGAFTKLIALQKLDLSTNLLTSKVLNSETFKGKYNPSLYEPMKNLTNLNLSNNKLHSLQQDVFSHFPRIEVLNLSSNSFQHIDDLSKNAISSLGYITELDLSYMGLSELPTFLFHYHREDLKILRLNGNNFEKVPTEAIGKAIKLEALYLNENPFIKFDGDNKFPILPNMKELYISNCPNLVKIGPESFSGMQNLTKLFITNNPSLKIIHANAVVRLDHTFEMSFPPLKEIYLRNNSLETLPLTLFDNWHTVKKIDIRDNPWECTCKNNFLINVLFPQIRNQSLEFINDVRCEKPEKLHGVLFKNFNVKNGVPFKCSSVDDSASLSGYTIMTGLFLGVLMSIPLAFIFIVVYRRGCFGLVNTNDPARFSRAFYSRTKSGEEFM